VYPKDHTEHDIFHHSEKLAIASGFINRAPGRYCSLNKEKNLWVCEDCHTFHKFHPKNSWESHHVRDANCFHHFEDGVCSLHGLLVMPVVQLLDILCSLFNSMWDIWRKILHHEPPQIFCKICFTSHTYTDSNLAPFMTSIQVSKWKWKKERLPDGSTFNPCPSQTLKISISPSL
jgi:hypothetical protein